ncbi:Capsule polysaccharide biosynthesis protein [Anatilimnocola aggregata]|uniref:Capsule polysaccharide biosynthesis protein n=1 Tax=Anatilimnocola aggregata TaxID=2528021 RepID=A0A517YIR7_9BACT|nr:hypothetical protein [Anatilimnocola aggregata]QDU30119.1 Capsule polysaccharide biosynthesis protein [Anatilimnocola aggregata]
MKTIVVEDRTCLLAKPVLQAIADTCISLGHRVVRWRGPLSGRVPHSRRLQRCHAAFVWNGVHPSYAPAMAELAAMQARVANVELGWNPQRGTCQIDTAGINATASWSSEPLLTVGKTPLAVRPQGDLLVPLQLDRDTQITQLSPSFANMRALVEFLCRNSRLPVRVRPHPKAPADPLLQQTTLRLGGSWDDSSNFAMAVQRCRAVALVNSSVGVEALGQQLPVLCFGQSIYRHEGAVYCLNNDPAATAQVTSELQHGHCTLTVERVAAAYHRVMSHQWTHAEIPQRLPAIVDQLLAGTVDFADQPYGLWSQLIHLLTPWTGSGRRAA